MTKQITFEEAKDMAAIEMTALHYPYTPNMELLNKVVDRAADLWQQSNIDRISWLERENLDLMEQEKGLQILLNKKGDRIKELEAKHKELSAIVQCLSIDEIAYIMESPKYKELLK